jgi:hypothetical protein
MRLDDASGDGQAQAGPLGLGGVERLEDPLAVLRAEPRAVVADGDAEGGEAVDLGPRAPDLDLDRVGACGQGILEEIVEDLPQAEGVDRAAQVRLVALPFPERGRPARPLGLQVSPGLPPDRGQVAVASLQPDRAA